MHEIEYQMSTHLRGGTTPDPLFRGGGRGVARGGGNKWPARPLVKTILRVPMHMPLYGHRSGMLCGVSELYVDS